MNTGLHGSGSQQRRFRIGVAGRLDQRFVDGLQEAELLDSPEGSILDGPFIDQSYLRGILDRLWQLGIEVRGFETYLADTGEQSAAEENER